MRKNSTGAMIFERAPHQFYPVCKKRRRDGVARKSVYRLAVELEFYRLFTVDAAAGWKTE
jgi:hypothetical protein